MKDKIGVALITYERPNYAKESFKSIVRSDYGGADVFVIVDDGSITKEKKDWLLEVEGSGHNVITKTENKGVAHSKNLAIKYLIDNGCEHIFLMEDDILMKSLHVCDRYIKTAKYYDVQHLNFALHGEMNIGYKRVYSEGKVPIVVYPNCVGAFSYYTKEVIDKIGLMDEKFVNAWEHVEHTYRIAEAGYTTPFWYFADIPNSERYLEEITNSIDNSVIRPRDDWQDNIKQGQEYWMQKHGKWLPTRE